MWQRKAKDQLESRLNTKEGKQSSAEDQRPREAMRKEALLN